MEDDYSNGDTNVETSKADRSVWLMKCPPIVSKAWQSSAASASADSPPVAKVVVSLDLLQPDDSSALQVSIPLLSLCAWFLLLLISVLVWIGENSVGFWILNFELIMSAPFSLLWRWLGVRLPICRRVTLSTCPRISFPWVFSPSRLKVKIFPQLTNIVSFPPLVCGVWMPRFFNAYCWFLNLVVEVVLWFMSQ